MRPSLRRALVASFAIPTLGIGAPQSSRAVATQGDEEGRASTPDLIVLVRHAERDGDSDSDPGLTTRGEARARELARLLADAGITRIHSTDTRRTRETAAPLAEMLGLEVEIYDGRALEVVALHRLSGPGRHLVVGHSNTTPELAELLGGESYGEIVEAWEYDRLYLLTPTADGRMRTVLLRFGPAVDRPEARSPPRSMSAPPALPADPARTPRFTPK